MKRIALVGPESSGKSTLAARLAEYLGTVWVEEYARTYLENLGRLYEESDLRKIAEGQLALERRKEKKAAGVLIIDTNLLVIKIWSEVKYGRVDPWIVENMQLERYDLHLLLAPDLPWEEDPQREHPHFREELFEMYRKALLAAGVRFVEISGTHAQRWEKAMTAVGEE